MPLPMMPSQAGRPIMDYVRYMEGQVLMLRQEVRKLKAARRVRMWPPLLFGAALGMAGTYALLVAVRYVR